ncbi:hypothetical protein BSLG_006862 [Batrachochytrium salamandrivorans]|nr:hypothetical protein BSLG_006862 [Batrachochytrium salamandrivorans]
MTQQPHPAAVVELAAFEHQKENIQPLRSGRSAAALAERFATATTTTTTTGHKAVSARESHYAGDRPKDPAMDPTATTHTDTAVATAEQLETRREAMERALDAVSDDSDDDPLDPFHRYIRWVEQYFSQDHVSYMRVLETAIRRFRKDIRYKNDPRHLMLWMRLAKRSPTPVDIFKYLSVNEIGQQTALYYEEYAGLMETCSKLDEAHEILLLGIHRNAQPLDRLVRSKTEFLARRSSATIAALSDTMESSVDPLLSGDMLDSDLESRPPLRHVDRYSIQDNSAAAHSIQPQTHQIQSNPYPLSSQSSHASSSIVRGRQSQTKMRVFADNAVDGGDGTDALRDRAMPTASFSNPWPVYDGEVQRRKENMPEATKWSGSTLPQKHSHLPPTAGMAKIPVYQDEAVRVPSTKATAMQLKEAHGILQDVNLTSKPMALLQSLSLEQPTEISISSKVPQNGQAKPIVSLSSHIPPSQPSQPSAKESVCIWRKEMFFVGGLELCLEEYRATMPRYAVDAVAHTNSNYSSVMDTSISSDMNLGDRSSDTHMASSFSLPPPAPERASSGSISNSLHYPTGSAIHAGAAMADIFEMFTVPLAAEDPKHVQPFENAHDWADDEDETISSKVYRPASASQKIGVFRDNNDDDEWPF